VTKGPPRNKEGHLVKLNLQGLKKGGKPPTCIRKGIAKAKLKVGGTLASQYQRMRRNMKISARKESRMIKIQEL